MEKETHEFIMAAKGAVVHMADIARAMGVPLCEFPVAMRLNDAVRAFEAAQAKHPEHVMFIKADDGARTR
jgi:hypothetical protein